MIDEKNVFYQSIQNNRITFENIRKIVTGQGDDSATGCLLDYAYSKDNYDCNIFKKTTIIRCWP